MNFLRPTVVLDPKGNIRRALAESSGKKPARSFENTFNGVEIPYEFERFMTRTQGLLLPELCKAIGQSAVTIVGNTVNVAMRAITEGVAEDPRKDAITDHFHYFIDTVAQPPKTHAIRSSARLAYAHHPELVDIRDAVKALNMATLGSDFPDKGAEVSHLTAGFVVSQFDQEYWQILDNGVLDIAGMHDSIIEYLGNGDVDNGTV